MPRTEYVVTQYGTEISPSFTQKESAKTWLMLSRGGMTEAQLERMGYEVVPVEKPDRPGDTQQ